MKDKPEQPLRILLLEDVPSDAELIESELRDADLAFVSQRADTREAFIRALEEFHPDIVLADYNLPAFDGGSALKIVREHYPTVPVVMVTGTLGDEKATELLRLGARDYVLKGQLARLAPAVQRALSEEQGIRARKAAERALRESEARYQAAMQTANDAIICMKPDGAIQLWNHKAEEMFGYPATEAVGLDLHQLIVPERFHEKATEGLRQFIKTGTGPVVGKTLELAAWRRDKTEFPIELSISPMNINGEWHATGIIRDIAGRKRAETALQHANRAFKTLSACNHELVHATDEQQLLQAMCRVIVEDGGYSAVWVGYKQDDAEQSVRLMARSGFEARYADALQITWADSERGRGPSGKAVRSGITQVVQDVASNPACAPWREQATQRNNTSGNASAIALPLHDNGEVFGSLTIYAAQANAFDPSEIALLEEMAGDLAYGIRTLRQRQEQQRHAKQVRIGLEGTIQAIASMVEMRDPYTAGHQQRVAQLAAAIAAEMGLPEERVHGIHLAGTIHDLGKIQTPAEILSKPGKLSATEYSLIKEHAQNGYEILKDIEFPWPVAQMAWQHHERLDGSGYPQGLKGNEILLEARILAVADVVEAMSSHRPYRPSLGMDAALEEIIKGRDAHYDPDVVNVCVRLFRENGFRFDSGKQPGQQ